MGARVTEFLVQLGSGKEGRSTVRVESFATRFHLPSLAWSPLALVHHSPENEDARNLELTKVDVGVLPEGTRTEGSRREEGESASTRLRAVPFTTPTSLLPGLEDLKLELT